MQYEPNLYRYKISRLTKNLSKRQSHAYRMADSLKTKLDEDNVNREKPLSCETIKQIIGRYCVVRGLDNELGYAHKVIDSFK